jgi:DNA-binding CsgD family transcriptional regulator
MVVSRAAPLADVLDLATRELAPLLGTNQTVALQFDARGAGVRIGHLTSPFPGAEEAARRFRSMMANHPRQSALFDALSPDPRQRNVVLSHEELRRLTGRSLHDLPSGQLLAQNGFDVSEVARVLLCDGPALLAWFGAFRDSPFQDPEREILARLVRPLRERLAVESRLSMLPWATSALNVALSTTGAAAVVVRRPLHLLHCNAAARALLASDREGFLSGLRDEMAGRGNGEWMIIHLSEVEGPEHFLAMRRLPPADPAPRAAMAAARFGLTARQVQVLEMVARGAGNKAIAAALRCSESAVEQHVTALLERYDVGSRAELVARFWTASPH